MRNSQPVKALQLGVSSPRHITGESGEHSISQTLGLHKHRHRWPFLICRRSLPIRRTGYCSRFEIAERGTIEKSGKDGCVRYE
ncbi:hypothetical protein PanWU01x14_147440 [Parasponia andersonii]|uniref:Uncharacterized protein n=1 Tax=Parasponia andersonii TaxID=3476 RepID=A0A2P5CJF1_PARAD|nr:hypothetical protein PanWU01x14_147440 [Parasponia andersonii]